MKTINYKYFYIIGMMNVTTIIATIPTIYKVIAWGAFWLPAATFIFPISYFLGDVVAETYGYHASRQLVLTTTGCELFFVGIIYFLINLPSAEIFQHDKEFQFVLGNLPRLAFSNGLGTFCGAMVNIYIISKYKLKMNGKKFWVRSLISTSFGELTVSIVAGILSFSNVISVHHTFNVILSTFLFKITYGLLAVWPATLLVTFLKNKEGIDVYDFPVRSLNPQRLS